MSQALFSLVCVLLSLFLINSPGEYTEQAIYDTERANQSQVDAIENDPTAYQLVVDTYGDDAEYVVIVDPDVD